MASQRLSSKFNNFHVSMDCISLSSSGFTTGPPLSAAHKEFAGFGSASFKAAAMKPFAGGGGDVENHNSSMMQSGAHGGRFDMPKNAQRPLFNEFSTNYLDLTTQSMWNEASNLALNVSTVSSDGGSSGSESSVPCSRPVTIYGRKGGSFFGDFGVSPLAVTPTKANNTFGGFPQKKASSERKAPREKVSVCAYCRGDHQIKNKQGMTVCPELRALKCPVCNNANPNLAHTVRFCPQIRVKRAIVLQQNCDAVMQISRPVLPNIAGI